MLFGHPTSLAIEAVPGPEAGLPRFVGDSLAGRMRIHLGGHVVGNFEEPCCVFRPLAEHLTKICAFSGSLWDKSLEGLSPHETFQVLDRACFRGQDEPYPVAFDLMGFLTNVSECFDDAKGFVVSPRPGVLLTLVQSLKDDAIVSCEVTVADWCSASASFAAWLFNEERAHAAGEA
jgi:hypothetical protein